MNNLWIQDVITGLKRGTITFDQWFSEIECAIEFFTGHHMQPKAAARGWRGFLNYRSRAATPEEAARERGLALAEGARLRYPLNCITTHPASPLSWISAVATVAALLKKAHDVALARYAIERILIDAVIELHGMRPQLRNIGETTDLEAARTQAEGANSAVQHNRSSHSAPLV